MKEEEKKLAEEQDPFEYLDEHLRGKVLAGGYKQEFRVVRSHLPILKEFRSFRKMLDIIGKETMRDLKEDVVREVVRLHQDRWDLHPSTGVVLIMVLWSRLHKVAPGGWFDDGVYWLLEEAELANPDEPGMIDSLMEVVRKRIRGKKFFDTRDGEKRLPKERVFESEEDNE